MRLPFLSFLLLFLLGCGFSKDDTREYEVSPIIDMDYSIKEEKDAIEYYFTACDSFEINSTFLLNEFTNTQVYWVYSDQANGYCSPDENSKIEQEFPFNAVIKTGIVINRIKNDTVYPYSAEPERYQVIGRETKWAKWINGEEIRYVKLADLTQQDFRIWGFTASEVMKDNQARIQLKSFNPSAPEKNIDQFMTGDLMHGFRLNISVFNGLKGGGQLIRYETFRESCPGANLNELILLKNGKFHALLSAFATGEMGEYEAETIYYPMKFDNGKVLLVANADLENIFNLSTAELNVFEYNEDIGIPIEELVVRVKRYSETIMDENGEPKMDAQDIDYLVNDIVDEPEFFRWDGEKLIKQ